jgi:hypothetical protein
MVILSLPFVSNSLPGHPDKTEFSADAGQATLIQINHVRYRTLICRTQANTRLIAKQASGGEFRACAQKILLFFSPGCFAQTLRPEYVEDDGRLRPGLASDNKQERTLIRSVHYFNSLSIINLRFFPRQVE